MTRVFGILETALSVADVKQSADFYRQLFDFPTLLESERLIALDVVGRNVLLLFLAGKTNEPFDTPGGSIPAHGASGRSHLAFSITADDFDPWQENLRSKGIAIESCVAWPGGAKSVYFRDPDQHLVELITPGFWSTY
jgi:catechol 2,3-dioxygenase-like lactoylglutathione lyase family enzyme